VKRLSAAMLVTLLGMTSAASAAPQAYDIDPVHSQVGFSIKHIFSKLPGQFKQFSGVILADEKNPTASSVDVTIQTASIFTDNEQRDAHLRSADFFAADSFPTITFKSTKVTPAGKTRYRVTGRLTMRGVTKTVVLDMEFLGRGAVSLGGQSMGTKAGFEATTTINRQDYGIRYNKILDQGGLMIGNEVAVDLHVEATLRTPPAK
jgi:polyisoprenoid-binding protein YceI